MGLPSSNTNTSSSGLVRRVERNRSAPLLAYLELTKPRLLPMVLFTGLPVLAFAASGWPSPARGFLTLLGVALAAASANALNAYVERDTDALMER
ncbi:MAG: UbiA family prenyltransferase, partial [Myxococcota bacterium]